MAGKIITIDWQTIKELPSETYQVKLLNKQQSAILLALCEYQHWQSRWDNLELDQQELDRMMGDIEFRLMGDEESMTLTKEDICEAIECAAVKIASRLVSGSTGGFSVGEDGEVIVGGGDGDESSLPEDDPETVIDETASSKSGAMLSIVSGFQEMLQRLDGFWAAPVVDTVAQVYMESLYQIADTASLLLAIQQYYAYRTTPLAAYTIPATLAQFFYCKGLTLGTMTEWALDIAPDALDDCFINLYRCLDTAQISEWFNKGAVLPSTAYVEYPCVPVAYETFTLDMSTANFPQYTTNAVHKQGHRIKIKVSGSFVDSDVAGQIQDFFYHVNTGTGVKTFVPADFQIQRSGLTEPTQALVPYQPSHVYEFTVDITPTSGASSIIFGRDNGASFILPNVSGILTFEVTDLGEYTV